MRRNYPAAPFGSGSYDRKEDKVIKRGNECSNLNHRRKDAPVRFCPDCREVVNESVPTKKCSEERHTQRRSQGTKYCVDCGEQLVQLGSSFPVD